MGDAGGVANKKDEARGHGQTPHLPCDGGLQCETPSGQAEVPRWPILTCLCPGICPNCHSLECRMGSGAHCLRQVGGETSSTWGFTSSAVRAPVCLLRPLRSRGHRWGGRCEVGRLEKVSHTQAQTHRHLHTQSRTKNTQRDARTSTRETVIYSLL